MIYEKKNLDRLIDDVSDLMCKLMNLFPAAQKDQKALCKTEVFKTENIRQLTILNDIAGKDDKILTIEVEEEMNNRGHIYTDMKIANSKMWGGDENALGVRSKGHSYTGFTVSDHSDVHLGNKNKG